MPGITLLESQVLFMPLLSSIKISGASIGWVQIAIPHHDSITCLLFTLIMCVNWLIQILTFRIKKKQQYDACGVLTTLLQPLASTFSGALSLHYLQSALWLLIFLS